MRKLWQESRRMLKVITLERKLAIIEELKKGKSRKYVSELYQAPKSTAADIWKLKDNRKSCDNPSFAKKKCIMKAAQFEALDKAY